MILIALLLASLGVADLARERFGGRRGVALGILLGLIVAVLGTLGTGVNAAWIAALVVALLGWQALTDYRAKTRVGYWPLALLAVAVAAAWAFSPAHASPHSLIAEWYSALPYAFSQTVGFDTFALAIGGIIFLFETANVIVRIILPAEKKRAPQAPPATGPARGRPSWLAKPPAAPEPLPQSIDLAPLKGGRLIGPLERLFILALALAGQFTAIGAVIAAKGIIRFPEISRDDSGGSKAEYFLVGSFASWALVLVVAVLLQLSM